MRSVSRGRVLLVLLLLGAVTAAVAQKADSPKYDASQEIKFKGTVDDIQEVQMGKEKHIELAIKTADQVYRVCVCPPSFLKEFEVTFEKGEELQVTGAKAKMDGADIILAREIVNGNNTLTLRDKQGGPVWTWLKKG